MSFSQALALWSRSFFGRLTVLVPVTAPDPATDPGVKVAFRIYFSKLVYTSKQALSTGNFVQLRPVKYRKGTSKEFRKIVWLSFKYFLIFDPFGWIRSRICSRSWSRLQISTSVPLKKISFDQLRNTGGDWKLGMRQFFNVATSDNATIRQRIKAYIQTQ